MSVECNLPYPTLAASAQTRLFSAEALRRSLGALLGVARGVEDEALQAVPAASGRALLRLRRMRVVVRVLIAMVRWQVRGWEWGCPSVI